MGEPTELREMGAIALVLSAVFVVIMFALITLVYSADARQCLEDGGTVRMHPTAIYWCDMWGSHD